MRIFELFEYAEVFGLRKELSDKILIYAERWKNIAISKIDMPEKVAKIICADLKKMFDKKEQIYFIPEHEPGGTDAFFNHKNGNITVYISPISIIESIDDRPSLIENPKAWCKDIIGFLGHELLHRDQWLRKKGSVNWASKKNLDCSNDFDDKYKDREYYRQPEEIAAYARQAVDTMLQFGTLNTPEKIKNALVDDIQGLVNSIEQIRTYWYFFGDGSPKSQKIWNKFLKLVYYYAGQIDS